MIFLLICNKISLKVSLKIPVDFSGHLVSPWNHEIHILMRYEYVSVKCFNWWTVCFYDWFDLNVVNIVSASQSFMYSDLCVQKYSTFSQFLIVRSALNWSLGGSLTCRIRIVHLERSYHQDQLPNNFRVLVLFLVTVSPKLTQFLAPWIVDFI